MHISTKTYHDLGPCCFRQHRADSHCKYLHGYALSFKLTFAAHTLDHRRWCIDFGGLKEVEQALKDTFDHTTIVAIDDPQMSLFQSLHDAGVIDMRVFDAVGCEAFAHRVHRVVDAWLLDNGHSPRVSLRSVEVFENRKNSAAYQLDGIAGWDTV